MKCDVCMSQRWQLYVVRWKDDSIAGDWKPFDRGSWSFLNPAGLAAALATKTLRPCPACNPAGVAPWSKSWTSTPAAYAGAGATETPF